MLNELKVRSSVNTVGSQPLYQVIDTLNGNNIVIENVNATTASRFLNANRGTIRRCADEGVLFQKRYSIIAMESSPVWGKEWDKCCADLKRKYGKSLSQIKLTKGDC